MSHLSVPWFSVRIKVGVTCRPPLGLWGLVQDFSKGGVTRALSTIMKPAKRRPDKGAVSSIVLILKIK